MPKCIVIGGGIAGLTAAVYLSEKGVEVELIESSPKLGGRAYSFLSKKQNTVVDNGQHVLMGCYNNTFKYLKKINSISKLLFQKKLNINYIERGGKIFELESRSSIYPINLIIGLLKLKTISFGDRVKILRLLKSLWLLNPAKLIDKTVYEWLSENNQTEKAIKLFWEMLVVSIMNTSPEKASARLFVSTLKIVFLHGNNGSRLVIPNRGLSEVFCDNAVEFIEKRNGKIRYSERVVKLEYKKNKITGIVTNKNRYTNFDSVVSAVPSHSLIKFYPGDSLSQSEKYFNYSPILTVHLWLKENNFKKQSYGFLDSEIHWLFNHKTHVSLLTSNAVNFVGKTNSEIIKIFTSELESFFTGFTADNITSAKIIKEKRATFLPTNEFENIRKQINSDFSNLFFAGDWTNTGLPSTIESAVKSGMKAFDDVTN